jgi:hypothetical protein
LKYIKINPQFNGSGLTEDDMDSYAGNLRNEWTLPISYSLYDGGYTTVLDIRLDNPLCHVSYANNGIITITHPYEGVIENNAQLGISDFVYANGLNFITDTSTGLPITLSNHYNDYDINGFNISVMICFQEYYPESSGIILFKYGNLEMLRSGEKDTFFLDDYITYHIWTLIAVDMYYLFMLNMMD